MKFVSLVGVCALCVGASAAGAAGDVVTYSASGTLSGIDNSNILGGGPEVWSLTTTFDTDLVVDQNPVEGRFWGFVDGELVLGNQTYEMTFRIELNDDSSGTVFDGLNFITAPGSFVRGFDVFNFRTRIFDPTGTMLESEGLITTPVTFVDGVDFNGAGTQAWAFITTLGERSDFTFDTDVVTIVPAPGVAGVLALGGLVAVRRRR